MLLLFKLAKDIAERGFDGLRCQLLNGVVNWIYWIHEELDARLFPLWHKAR